MRGRLPLLVGVSGICVGGLTVVWYGYERNEQLRGGGRKESDFDRLLHSNSVVVFGKQSCGHCHAAHGLLDGERIQHTYVLLDNPAPQHQSYGMRKRGKRRKGVGIRLFTGDCFV